MNTAQNYAVATSYASTTASPDDSWPTLSDVIDTLTDVKRTAQHPVMQAPHNYHLLRSIEQLEDELVVCIKKLHPEILDAIGSPFLPATAQTPNA